jgi:hypothetical protein
MLKDDFMCTLRAFSQKNGMAKGWNLLSPEVL